MVTAPTCDHAHLQTKMCTCLLSSGQQVHAYRLVPAVGSSLQLFRPILKQTLIVIHPLFPDRTCRLKAHFPSVIAFSYLEERGWEQKQSERGQPGLKPSSNNDGCHYPQWKMTQQLLAPSVRLFCGCSSSLSFSSDNFFSPLFYNFCLRAYSSLRLRLCRKVDMESQLHMKMMENKVGNCINQLLLCIVKVGKKGESGLPVVCSTLSASSSNAEHFTVLLSIKSDDEQFKL